MAWELKDLEENLLIGSTLVEGSTLSENEARRVLSGRTISGHPAHEALELLNYSHAVSWLIEELKISPYISLNLIQSFHERLFEGLPGERGSWKQTTNFTFRSNGEKFHYAKPEEVPQQVQSWVNIFNSSKNEPKGLPFHQAASLYYQFQCIHPFDDGNGRIGRVLLAYWLFLNGNLTFHFFASDRLVHLNALESGNDGDLTLLEQFIRERTKPVK